MTAFALFAISAAAIYFACEFFVNGIEWLGRRLNVGAIAVGSVLAAFGTALPESVVTFTAVVLRGSAARKDLGVGAAMGGPLVLATVAYAVVGATLVLNRGRRGRPARTARVDRARLTRDQGTFLWVFAVKVGLGLVAFAFKPWLGWLFVAVYALYVRREIRDGGGASYEVELEPLRIRPSASASLGWAALQVLLSLAAIGVASQVFVAQIGSIGAAWGWPPHLVALLLSPIATELPETMNAVIWVRRGHEALALANISGSMMVQATIPSALGIFFTPWRFDTTLLASGVVTALAVAYLRGLFRRGEVDGRALVAVSALYALFAMSLAAGFA